jgi:hypothetical protein
MTTIRSFIPISKFSIFFCFLIGLIQYVFLTPDEPNDFYRISMLSLSIVGTFAFFIIRKIQFNGWNLFSISTIFILGYVVVYYQIQILDLIGITLSPGVYNFIWSNDSVINQSIGLATIGLLSFYLGFVLFIKNISLSNIRRNQNFILNKRAALVIILAYLAYTLFFITSGSYSSGVYYADDRSSLSVYFFTLFDLSLSAAIIIKTSFMTQNIQREISFYKYLQALGVPVLLLVSWHILFSIYVGDRGEIISYMLLTFGLYFVRFKKISIINVLLIIYFSSIAMQILGDVRQVGSQSETGYTDRVVNSYLDKSSGRYYDEILPYSILSSTLELSISVNTLNHSLDHIPREHPFRYGLFELQYVLNVIPGLSGFVSKILYEQDKKYYSPSNFISYLIQGDHRSYSNGTSMLADIYIDFGSVGIIFGLFVLGVFMSKGEYMLMAGSYRPSIMWVTTMVFFSNALYLSRSSIAMEFSSIVLIYVLIVFNSYFVTKSVK